MKNLHLKNLNIDHTKTKIKYLLNTIKPKDKIIENFKQLYIKDLYNKDYDTEHLYIKCTNPNYKLKTALINYQNDILNEYIDTKDIEVYDIYQDYYGYECFQHNTITTIKGIKL